MLYSFIYYLVHSDRSFHQSLPQQSETWVYKSSHEFAYPPQSGSESLQSSHISLVKSAYQRLEPTTVCWVDIASHVAEGSQLSLSLQQSAAEVYSCSQLLASPPHGPLAVFFGQSCRRDEWYEMSRDRELDPIFCGTEFHYITGGQNIMTYRLADLFLVIDIPT